MFSSLQRLQNVTSLATTCVMVLLAAISITSYFTIPELELGNIGVKQFVIAPGTGFQSNLEFALLRFDVQADLTPLFGNWNTKQLYVSLTADYNNTRDGTENSIVLWDRIVTRKRPEAARLRIDGGKAKKVWKGPKGMFKDIPKASLTLRYDIMPYVGILVPGIAGRAKNPSWNGVAGSGSGNGTELGQWELAVPKVKAGGI